MGIFHGGPTTTSGMTGVWKYMDENKLKIFRKRFETKFHKFLYTLDNLNKLQSEIQSDKPLSTVSLRVVVGGGMQ